ncbi:MAG: RES domain-containing protein [Acidobacteriota bacterium]|nr:RES domain-containing protein [Acidobacteriota bacterium]
MRWRRSPVVSRRWNSIGRRVVYRAGSQSLAAHEILAHAGALGENYIVIAITIPEGVYVEEIELQWLPEWEIGTTRSIGDEWLTRGRSAVLKVPSKVIAVEYNYVINPEHEDFARLTMSDPEPFRFDQRLLERFIGLR